MVGMGLSFGGVSVHFCESCIFMSGKLLLCNAYVNVAGIITYFANARRIWPRLGMNTRPRAAATEPLKQQHVSHKQSTRTIGHFHYYGIILQR